GYQERRQRCPEAALHPVHEATGKVRQMMVCFHYTSNDKKDAVMVSFLLSIQGLRQVAYCPEVD
ncbi:MAG: hypothetical protein WAV59_10620, partial [Trichococcus flocculiformis]